MAPRALHLATPPSTLRGVLFDLDDTFLSHGRVSREAYNALCDLADAGLLLFPVTGRPLHGLGEFAASIWPVTGCILENGGVLVRRAPDGKQRRTDYAQDAHVLAENDQRLRALVDLAAREVPEISLSQDNPLRRTDISWDVGEHHRPSEDHIAALTRLAHEAGAFTVRSSVHLHARFDDTDKAKGSAYFLNAYFGISPEVAKESFVFVGDSGNDAQALAFYRHSVGVANLTERLREGPYAPRYITHAPCGAGFAEVAEWVLSARATNS